MRLLLGQEESAGQTYARVVDTPELAFGGDINVRGGAIKVTNTDSYNESSIFYGEEDENWGILDSDVSYGFGLNELGTASGTETFDDESDTYDQDITFSNGGLTYDQGSGGNLILPSFDKTDQYDINFADTVVSQDWGVLGISSAGGPAYDQHLYPYNTGFVSQEINNGYHDYGWVNEEIPIPTRYPYGSVYWTQPVPRAKTMWIPKWNGSGTLIVQGSGDERVAVASSTTTLFDFVGTTSPERYIAQTPENTVLYDTSGTLKESLTKDFVGSGSIALTQTQAVGFTTYRRVIFPPASGQYTLSGTVTEKWSGDPPEGTYLHIFGGAYTDLKLTYATQSTKAVMRLSGELNHPDIDYTPHYGIDRNIGIETGLTLLPGGGTDRITGITTAVYVPKYPGGQSLLDGKGGKTHEVITIDGRSISRTNAPISTHGVIYILGIGTAGNGVGGPEEKGDLDGVEFGATWRFTPATEYGIGSIMFDFTGGAESREINVYGYYGDDKDPGASGQITIRQEGGIYTLEKITKIYETVADGTGAYTYEGGATGEARTFSEVGSGSLYSIGGDASENAACMLQNSLLELPYSMERQKRALLQGIWFLGIRLLQYLHFLVQQRHNADSSACWFWNTYSQQQHRSCYWNQTYCNWIWFSLWIWFWCRGNSIPRICKFSSCRYLWRGRYKMVRSLPRLHYIWISYNFWGTFPSTYRLHSSRNWWWILNILRIGRNSYYTERGWCWYIYSIWYCNSKICKSGAGRRNNSLRSQGKLLQLRSFIGCTLLQHLVLLHFLVLEIPEKFRHTDTTETTKILAHREHLHSPILLLYIHLSIIRLQLVLEAQFSTVFTEAVQKGEAWAPVYGTGSFKKLASVKEAYGKGTYVGFGAANILGAAPTEYLVFEEGRTYLVII